MKCRNITWKAKIRLNFYLTDLLQTDDDKAYKGVAIILEVSKKLATQNNSLYMAVVYMVGLNEELQQKRNQEWIINDAKSWQQNKS